MVDRLTGDTFLEETLDGTRVGKGEIKFMIKEIGKEFIAGAVVEGFEILVRAFGDDKFEYCLVQEGFETFVSGTFEGLMAYALAPVIASLGSSPIIIIGAGFLVGTAINYVVSAVLDLGSEIIKYFFDSYSSGININPIDAQFYSRSGKFLAGVYAPNGIEVLGERGTVEYFIGKSKFYLAGGEIRFYNRFGIRIGDRYHIFRGDFFEYIASELGISLNEILQLQQSGNSNIAHFAKNANGESHLYFNQEEPIEIFIPIPGKNSLQIETVSEVYDGKSSFEIVKNEVPNPGGKKLFISDNANRATGSTDSDILFGLDLFGGDILLANSGDDILIGSQKDDELNGENGKDKLIPRAGDDFLRGGRDHDTYVFTDDWNGNVTITDSDQEGELNFDAFKDNEIHFSKDDRDLVVFKLNNERQTGTTARFKDYYDDDEDNGDAGDHDYGYSWMERK